MSEISSAANSPKNAASAATSRDPKTSRKTPRRTPKREVAAPFLVGLFTFLLYAFNVSPTVTYGSDCGEFAATVWNLGVGHPTGFAFYCVVARLFTVLLPFGEVAWRLNVLSALFGAMAVALVFDTLLRVLQHRVLDVRRAPLSPVFPSVSNDNTAIWASVGASLLLAGFYFFMGQAVIIDVHIMIAAMTALLIWCAVRWHHSVLNDEADFRWLYSLALLAGLALNTHMSWIFAFPGLFYLTVWRHKAVFGTRRQWWKRLASLFAFTAAAYAITLYLPLRASLFPTPQNGQWWPLDWTHITNFPNWYAHVRAHQYEFLFLQPTPFEFGGKTHIIKWFAASPTLIPGKIVNLVLQVALQWLWACILIPVGTVVAWKRDRALGIALSLIVVANVGFEINYNVPIGEMANFIFPTYLVLALWLGFGLQAMLQKVAQVGERWDDKSRDRAARDRAARDQKSSTRSAQKMAGGGWKWRLNVLAKTLVIATVGAQWSISVPMTTRRGDTSARDVALARASDLEALQRRFPGQKVTAVLTGSDDTLWSFWYAQFVLSRARGVQTPWGLPLRQRIRTVGLNELTRQWQVQGPVAYARFQPEIDARFPFTLLSSNGLLWQASQRKLPLPAVPLSNIEYSNSSRDIVLAAHFPAETVRKKRDFDGKSRGEIAHLKRENLTLLSLDFRAPFVASLSPAQTGATTTDAQSRPFAVQSGFIELLVAPRETFLRTPSPSQSEIEAPHVSEPSALATEFRAAPLEVTKQVLRLVVPQGIAVGTVLRAQLPLQIGVAGLGEHVVWCRLTRHKNDATTPWQRVAVIEVTAS